jgi:tetraacyldisaccharide 4'-kinase
LRQKRARHIGRRCGHHHAIKGRLFRPSLAAIAKPQLFFDGLREQGLELGLAQAWPDHDTLIGFNPDVAEGDWFCTEKDAVKLWARFPQIWAVPLELHGLDLWWPQIDQALTLRISSHHGNQIA